MLKKSCALWLVFCLVSSVSAVAQEWERWPSSEVFDHPKIAAVLDGVIAEADHQSGRPSLEFEVLRLGSPQMPVYDIYLERGQVRVVIEAESERSIPKIVASLQKIGSQVELTYDTQIQALVPIAKIQAIADLAEVQFVRPPVRPFLDQGRVVSEGRALIGAPAWNEAKLDGRGVKVGLIDPDFYRYERLLGKELPPSDRVTARSFRRDRRMYDPDLEEGHGTAVGELVYDIAPGAGFNLAAFETDVEFRKAVDWMIEEKVNVINTSLGFPSGCFRGEGLFEPHIKKAREAGITWVTSAGNRGDGHWEGAWTDNNNNNSHEFSGFDETLTIEAELIRLEIGGQQVAGVFFVFIFSWDADCRDAGNDYDIALFPESAPDVRIESEWLWRAGIPVKIAGGVFYVRNPNLAGRRDSFGVEIFKNRRAAAPARMDLVANICIVCHTFEYLMPKGSISIFEPAISLNAIAVGAFHHDPTRCPSWAPCPDGLLAYSSRGPAKDGRIKPDITAPSHVSTSTFGRFRGGDDGQGFDGTSASAPHAAGAAALVKQAFPNFTPKQIQDFLEGRAEDRGARGKDNDWGAGQLVLGEVIIIPAAPTDLAAVGRAPREIALTWKDQANNEEGFSIERRFHAEEAFSEIARLDPDVISFTDTAILPETTYCYRVRAFTRTGQSDYSNEACAASPAEIATREFSAELQQGAFSRIELPAEIKDALPVGVSFVEEPNATVGERTSNSLADVGLQLSPSTGSIFGSPTQSGNFQFLLKVWLNGHQIAQIWALVTIKPPALLAKRSVQTGSPPQILFIDFPAQIRADGKSVKGFVGFSDPDGDVVKADFTVVSATDFQSFQLTPDVKGHKEGAFPFEITTAVSQRVTISVTLTDEAGQTSPPEEFSFDALPVPILQVSPDRLNQSGMAGLGDLPPLTLEVRNAGGGVLNWTALTDAPWLQLNPSSGGVSGDEVERIELQADNKTLRPGLYRGLVMIRALGAQNSPQWVRFVLELTPAGGTLRWSTQIGQTDFSPAIGADGTIYVAAIDQTIYALASDGQVRWTLKAGGAIAASAAAIAPDGTIYIGSDDGNLYAITPEGKEQWRFTAGLPVRSGPGLGADGTIYIGSGSQSDEAAKVYALQPNGLLKWRPFEPEGGVVSSPAIAADGTIYFGSLDERVYALHHDGFFRKWRFRSDGAISSSPAIGADGAVYIGSNDGHLYALGPDGKEKWRFKTGDSIVSSPAIDSDGTIYVGSLDGHLYTIAPNGKERWRFKTNGPVHSSPAVAADGAIYIGSDDGNLYAVNSDGTQRWIFKTGGEVRSSPVIMADGTIYITSRDGLLYAIRGEAGPANSSWPMFRHDAQRTGRVSGSQ